jgi:spore maturation protein B
MSVFFALLVPCIFLLSFVYALFKKVRLFDCFSDGVKGAIPLIVSIFPYIATVAILSKAMEVSGLQARLSQLLSPFFNAVGVPNEIAPLLLIKPLSGSGAISVLSDILGKYGVDSFIGRCACVCYGSSETIFYIGAVYFAGIKRKKLSLAILIALISYLLSTIFSCFLCTIM